MENLEEKLEYRFKNRGLLETALTHSSFANENRKSGVLCNERLEFLGDSVLGLTVAEYLYINKSEMPEGRMTRLRAELVCEKTLAGVAAELDLGSCIRLGKGEELCGGRRRPSILADAVEAVLAAMYLDGGKQPVANVIYKYILSRAAAGETDIKDYKTALQELVQKKNGQMLEYHMLDESGPDHRKSFSVEVRLNGECISEGKGKSKKEAEQAAAKGALEALGE